MAHGGLSQAGKVKRLTPKVNKQERSKKRLTGRAKKRVQYNRMLERDHKAKHSGYKAGPNKNVKA